MKTNWLSRRICWSSDVPFQTEPMLLQDTIPQRPDFRFALVVPTMAIAQVLDEKISPGPATPPEDTSAVNESPDADAEMEPVSFKPKPNPEYVTGVKLLDPAPSIDRIFYLAAGLAAVCGIFLWGMGWHDVRKKEGGSRAAEGDGKGISQSAEDGDKAA
ncbi:MFS multidrug transporter [Apiospora phragmitis]|uniref:MFS multidrug transporter n=1 Tax=Apiospora phragmitis TaxID=2905665 RepID=A0ABR1T3Y2_9PEZI